MSLILLFMYFKMLPPYLELKFYTNQGITPFAGHNAFFGLLPRIIKYVMSDKVSLIPPIVFT